METTVQSLACIETNKAANDSVELLLAEALATDQIPAALVTLEAADRVFNLLARQIEYHEQLTDRMRWFLGDYYNTLRTRYSRDEIANALTPIIGSSITIATVEDYALVCKRVPPAQRSVFTNIHAASEVVRRSLSYAREELQVPQAQMRAMTKQRLEVEKRAEEIRQAVIETLFQNDEPVSTPDAIRAIEQYARQINQRYGDSHVQITHRSQRPPLTIEYAPDTITGSPIGGVQGEMSALEFVARITRLLGLTQQAAPVQLRIENPRTGYQYEVRFTLHVPRGSGDPYRITELEFEEIIPANYTEDEP